MNDTYTVRLTVRSNELDVNGHAHSGVYWQYGDHARRESMRLAGIAAAQLAAADLDPVTLETTIRFRRPLALGDEVEVTCGYLWNKAKTWRVEQQLRLPGNIIAAEITSIGALLDLATHQLVPDPAGLWRELATHPHILGL